MNDQVKSMLLNIDLRAFRAKIVAKVKDSRSDEIEIICNQRLQEVFGPEFKIDSDLADFNHICFPYMVRAS